MLTTVLTLVLLGAVAAQDECDSVRTDECGLKAWPFLVDPTRMPSNQAELDDICKTLREGNACVKDYVEKCPNVIRKSVSDSVVDSFAATVEDMCGGNLGKRFLPHGQCLKENLAKNFTCNVDTIKLLEKAAIYEPSSERLKLTCCIYLNLDKCFTATTTAACDSRAARVIRNIMQSYAIFMVDKCLPFLSQPETCDLSVLASVTSSRRPKTFLPALVDVASVAF